MHKHLKSEYDSLQNRNRKCRLDSEEYQGDCNDKRKYLWMFLQALSIF